MDYSNLPAVCLEMIFNDLPLRYLLWMNRVCKNWYRVQLIAIRKRTDLILVIGDYELASLFHVDGHIPEVRIIEYLVVLKDWQNHKNKNNSYVNRNIVQVSSLTSKVVTA